MRAVRGASRAVTRIREFLQPAHKQFDFKATNNMTRATALGILQSMADNPKDWCNTADSNKASLEALQFHARHLVTNLRQETPEMYFLDKNWEGIYRGQRFPIRDIGRQLSYVFTLTGRPPLGVRVTWSNYYIEYLRFCRACMQELLDPIYMLRCIVLALPESHMVTGFLTDEQAAEPLIMTSSRTLYSEPGPRSLPQRRLGWLGQEALRKHGFVNKDAKTGESLQNFGLCAETDLFVMEKETGVHMLAQASWNEKKEIANALAWDYDVKTYEGFGKSLGPPCGSCVEMYGQLGHKEVVPYQASREYYKEGDFQPPAWRLVPHWHSHQSGTQEQSKRGPASGPSWRDNK